MTLLDKSEDGSSTTASKKEKNYVYANIMVLLKVLSQWKLYDSKVTDIKLGLNKKDFHWQIF